VRVHRGLGWIDGTDRHGSLLMRPCLSDPQGGQHAIDEVAVLAVGQMACRDLKVPIRQAGCSRTVAIWESVDTANLIWDPASLDALCSGPEVQKHATASYRWILVRDDG
jgi:hypothetical protein